MRWTKLELTVCAALLQACSSAGTAEGGPSGAAGSAEPPTNVPSGAGFGASSGPVPDASGGTGGAPNDEAGGVTSGGGGAGEVLSNGGAAGHASSGAGGANSGSGAACAANGGPVSVTDLAFAEAEGFGRHATGGRDGAVYHVSNIDDSGAGSFRDAVSQANRIVVFDVGGTITLKTAVSAKSNLTIAGQTAPGGGIAFRGGEISFANSSNVIVRHVRIRPGDDTASSEDDALSLFRAKNVIIDHASLEFAPWNNIDGVSDDWQTHPVTDITFQDSIVADPTGQQFGAHTESVSSQWSWYRNIFANSHNRNPLAKVDNVFVNNVLYNCSAGYTTHTSTNFKHDIVNNYFIFGPASTGTDNTWYQLDKNQSLYYAGNLKDTNLNGTLDGAATTPYWYQGAGTILSAPWSAAGLVAAALSAPSAYRVAVSQSGALPRDTLDALVIDQVRTLGKGTTGTGANTVGPSGALYTSQTQTGLANDGYGALVAGSAAPDTEHDGMPDFWEQLGESSPAADDAMQKAPDGYTLIEHYLNWLAEPHALTKADASVDVDLASFASGFKEVSPVFTVPSPACGSVQLQSDGHTARFTPAPGFVGLSAFAFKVAGSDGSAYSASVTVAVQR